MGFDFTDEELLIVFFSFDCYLIIDPQTGYFKQKNLKSQFTSHNPIKEAKIIDNKILFYTIENSKMNFYIIDDIFKTNEIPFNSFQLLKGQTFPFVCPIS